MRHLCQHIVAVRSCNDRKLFKDIVNQLGRDDDLDLPIHGSRSWIDELTRLAALLVLSGGLCEKEVLCDHGKSQTTGHTVNKGQRGDLSGRSSNGQRTQLYEQSRRTLGDCPDPINDPMRLVAPSEGWKERRITSRGARLRCP